jgi:hypothetical protein
MDPEPPSARPEPLPLVPLDQIAYFDEDGRSALTLKGLTILRSPDVILGLDLVTGSETVFYGRDVVERTLETGHAEGHLLRVALDLESNEPELLAGAVMAIRGWCDYPEAPPAPGAPPVARHEKAQEFGPAAFRSRTPAASGCAWPRRRAAGSCPRES